MLTNILPLPPPLPFIFPFPPLNVQALLPLSVPQRQPLADGKSISSISSQAKSTQDFLDDLSNTSFSVQDPVYHKSASMLGGAALPASPDSMKDGRDKYLSTSTDDSDESWCSDSVANGIAGRSIMHCRDLGRSQMLSNVPNKHGGGGGGAGRGGGGGGSVCGNMAHQRSSVDLDEPSGASWKHPPRKQIMSSSHHECEEESGYQVKSSLVPSTVCVASTPGDKDDVLIRDDFPCTKKDAVNADISYGFEFPRCCSVIGTCSWNMLPLATHSNLVKAEQETGT